MKSVIFKWLSGAVTLPLIVVTLLAANPAGAEQIDRSRSRIEEPTPSVTDLNLSIPVDRGRSSTDSIIQPNSIRKNSTATNLDSTTTSSNNESSSKVKSIRRRSSFATNFNASASEVNTQSAPAKSIRRRTSTSDISTTNLNREGKSTTNSRRRIAAVSRPPLSGNYLRLVRDPSKGTNDNGNPIYTLEAYVGGERYHTFNAVSGVASSQKLDRNRGSNHAPLPDGLYSVSQQIVPGTVPEVGKTFIGISPQFETGRSDLGIHVDPSFNKQNGSDGTSGCIGLTTSADRDAINEFVLKYHPRRLFVSILQKEGEE
jgi:hypothetical protein